MGNPQERLLAWLAGILDGEGSISVQVYTLPDGRVRFTPFVCIVNSDEGILSNVLNLFTQLTEGAKSGKPRFCKHGGTIKPCYTIRVDGGPCCKAILEPLLPYLLSEKRWKAEQVLRYIESREVRGVERGDKGRIKRAMYSKEEVDLICSVRTHARALSSTTIRQAPNVLG